VSFPTTSPPLARALAERNYDRPTPVQIAVLADEAVDRDLLVSAQTGSGKTIAYGLAIAKNLLGSLERFERAAAPLALIVAPTRELALQSIASSHGSISMRMGASSPASAAWIRAANSASLPSALTSWSGRPAD
jgi:DEAD/DEAH box helicase